MTTHVASRWNQLNAGKAADQGHKNADKPINHGEIGQSSRTGQD
jgi:hypothetical protein